MEETVEMVEIANRQLRESKTVLEQLKNEVGALTDIIQPELMKHVESLRSARMAATSEINSSLTALREIRKFFLEGDYEIEMARMERFVALCGAIRELKRDGTFDAMCDSAIRLAVQETR